MKSCLFDLVSNCHDWMPFSSFTRGHCRTRSLLESNKGSLSFSVLVLIVVYHSGGKQNKDKDENSKV